MNRRGGGDNIDDFIASEMQQIDGGGGAPIADAKPTVRPTATGTGVKGLSSKPNFGFSGKKAGGGAFAKPSFAMGGGAPTLKKTGPTIVPKSSISGVKRKQADDDFIENELRQISGAGGY